MELSRYLQSLTPSVTLQVTAKAKELKAQGEDVIGFAAGEPDFDTPQFIKDAAIEALNSGVTKYTPATGTAEYKQAICDKFKADNGLDYTPDQIVISCGAKHSVFNAIKALVNEGDEIIIITPYWVSYPEMIKAVGGVPVVVETSFESGFKATAADIAAKVTDKTVAVVINSPSNPSGMIYSEEELKSFADLAVEKDIIVISDEIYEKLIYDGKKHVSIASFNNEIKDRTITINGMSKAYSMTGWRLGYLAAPGPIAKAISAFQSHSTSNPTSFAQAGGVAALTGPQDEIDAMREVFQKRRDMMFDLLSDIPKLKPLRSEGAFYMYTDISAIGMKALDFAGKLLDEKQVAVIPGEAFGTDTCIRLSFATSDENIERGIARIEEWLA